jgi:hypothetical protein
VEDAAESVVSSDVDSVESVGLDDRLGERAQGCRGAERAVGPVLVVEGFVFAQRMEKMGLVHGQGSVEEFGTAAFLRRTGQRWPTPGIKWQVGPIIAREQLGTTGPELPPVT